MSAHEAGALHAPGYGSIATVPAWLRPPADVNELLPQLWARIGAAQRGRRARGRRGRRAGPGGRVRHAGVRARRGRLPRPGRGLPGRVPRCVRRPVRRRRRLLRVQGVRVHRGARWLDRGRRAAPGHLLRRRAGGRCCAAGRRPRTHRPARQQQVRRPSSTGPSARASGGSSSTRCRRSTGSPRPPRRPASGRRSCCGSPSGSRRTPTSTSPPRTRTRSSGCRCRRGGRRGRAAGAGPPGAGPARPALAHRLADLRHQRLRGGRPPRCSGLHAQVIREHGVTPAGDRPGRRVRHRLHQRARPAARPRSWPTRWPRSSGGSARRWASRCPGSRWSRAGRSRAEYLHAVQRRDDQGRRARARRGPPLRRGRRRHERQHPHRPV